MNEPSSNGERRHSPSRRPQSEFGAAHKNPRDAYRDVPILKQPTWNNEIAAYFFLGGVSAGSALVGALAQIAGGKRHERLARTAHYVSFATLLPCPPLLIDDLGMPQRFHHMLRVFKPSSPMNVGSWALLTHGAGATLTVMRMLAEDHKLPLVGSVLRFLPEHLIAGLGVPSSLALAGYTGVLLGTTSIPVWYTSPLLGALFMSSSFSTGIAATSLASLAFGAEDGEEASRVAALGLVAGVTEATILAGYVATTGEAAKPLFAGAAGKLIWGAIAGLAAATLLEAAGLFVTGPHKKTISLLASVTALASGAMLRWGVMRAGHLSAADREGTIEAMKPRKGSPGWWRRG